MGTPKKLEQYLTQLDKALGKIAVSDRADIITEIRSHVLEAQEREPEKTIESILASLGEPEAVANKFLLERGLKPGNPPRTPMVKWLVIGFMGTMTIMMIFSLIVLFNFTPLIKVDEEEGTVQLLGGMIDITDSDIRVAKVEGRKEIDLKVSKKLKLDFSNGKFTLKQEEGNLLKWDCKATSNGEFPELKDDSVSFNFSNAKCEITYPSSLSLEMNGANAKVVMKKLSSSVRANIANGKIDFTPNEKTEYAYDLKVEHGKVDTFESSKNPNAIAIKIELGNGKISKGQ